MKLMVSKYVRNLKDITKLLHACSLHNNYIVDLSEEKAFI